MPRNQKELAQLIMREGSADPRIVEAFRHIDRAEFVPKELRQGAYLDRPVAIPERQTTSQPSLIARMIDAVDPQPGDKALEVGTGFGFQTALLAHLVDEVISIETHPTLVEAARRNLERAGVKNATVVQGDGWLGYPPEAPFDVIVVSAAATSLPAPLGEQLAEGGRLVIPLREHMSDDVYLFEKQDGNLVRKRLITPARFVPLVPRSP
jgi:protein-L-isoaspartate(D-aspartate) O-methyltransferase